MNPHVSPALLADLAQDCGWPSLVLGGVGIAREDGWRDALTRFPRLTPHERGTLLVRLEPWLLISSAHGRGRLRRWIDRQRVAPMPALHPKVLEGWVGHKLLLLGDDLMAPSIVHAVATLHPALRDLAVESVAFCAIGRGITGWAGGGSLTDCDGRRPYIVQVCGTGTDDDIGRVVAHELSHVWHKDPDLVDCLSIVGEIRYRAHLERQASPALALSRRWHEQDERRALAAELVWATRQSRIMTS